MAVVGHRSEYHVLLVFGIVPLDGIVGSQVARNPTKTRVVLKGLKARKARKGKNMSSLFIEPMTRLQTMRAPGR